MTARSPSQATALLAGLSFSFIVFLSGCASSPSLPEQRTYLLRAPSGGWTTSNSESLLSVDRVSIPKYLNRSELVVLVSPREVRAAKHHQWAEPLENGIQRYLQDRITSDLKDLATRQRVRVEVNVEELIGDLAGSIDLRASYQINFSSSKNPKTGMFSSTTEQQFDGYAGLVAGYENLLDALADTISAAIRNADR